MARNVTDRILNIYLKKNNEIYFYINPSKINQIRNRTRYKQEIKTNKNKRNITEISRNAHI